MSPFRSLLQGAAALALLAAPLAAQQHAHGAAPLNPNSASEKEIGAVTGVTPALAKAIVAARPFARASSFDSLLAKTLSPEQRKALFPHLFVPVELNTATDAEIMLIPGMGRRMVHEFKEYRPWKTQAQFQKEIGKYVDAAEVARLWSYSTIKP